MMSALVTASKEAVVSLVDKPSGRRLWKPRGGKSSGTRGAGVDGQSIERFAAGAERYLAELHENLKNGSYRRVRSTGRYPKGGGQTRPLGIPTIKDRIVQTALKMTIEPIFEVQFRPGSYGFRPGRSCKDALREVDRLLKEGYTHVVDAT